ncbi:MAG: two-component regulator propeller domain-containing protein [Vicinamibacterales bacterium]|nr:two-component regulator propeller domain-containing protein [Vicinamibacterales bacterium]
MLAQAIVTALLTGMASVAASQPRVVVTPGERQWVIGGWWRQAQGLPQDRVIALRQSRDGYVWVGTRGGVARFDGDRFVVWTHRTAADPPEGEVFSLAEPSDDGLWLAVYGGGLARFKDGVFSTLTERDGLVDDYPRTLAVGRDGAIWIGTERGLSRLLQGSFLNFRAKDGLAGESVRVVFTDTDGSILVGTDHGLQRLTGNRFETVTLPPDLTGAAIDSIWRDRRHRLWVGTSGGLLCLDGDSTIVYGPVDGLSSRAVRAVYEDSEGRIWAATNVGLDQAEAGEGGRLRFRGVLAGVDVITVIEDREHSLWVGSRAHGLVRLQRSLFTVFNTTSGLPADAVTTVFQSRGGVMWAGVGTRLCALRDSGVDTFGIDSGLPDRAVSSLAEDQSGRLWVGTEAGLFRSDAPVRCTPLRCTARFVPVSGHPALRSHVRVLRSEADAGMLVGTSSSGVFAVPTAGPTAAAPVFAGEIRAIIRESPDRLWVGTRDRGLAAVTPAGVTRFTTREGLPHDSVHALLLDPDGTLWIGTRRGLAWMRDGRLHAVTAAQGLHESHVYGIASDRQGRLWLSSGSGVFTVLRSELREYEAGTRSQISSVVYGLEHGLPSTLCALSHDPVITADARGHIWVATLGGVVSIDPAVSTTRVNPPPIHVESVLVDGVESGPGAPIETPHGRGTLVFRFAAPTFVAPERVIFQHRLEGFDSDWVEGGSSREVRYTNVPPGDFRFVVRAGIGDGAWADAGSSARIHLVPRFYQRLWFELVLGLVVAVTTAGTAIGLHRVRVRRLEASERELARRVEESIAHIKVLRGLLPTCAWCRRVRDDAGYWTQMEAYVRDHSHAEFSHGVCPDCLKANFPDDAESVGGEGTSPHGG